MSFVEVFYACLHFFFVSCWEGRIWASVWPKHSFCCCVLLTQGVMKPTLALKLRLRAASADVLMFTPTSQMLGLQMCTVTLG